MKTLDNSNYDDRFNGFHDLLMSIMTLEERLKKECIGDELTGVYLLDKVKLDVFMADVKIKAAVVCTMPTTKHGEKYQMRLNTIINQLTANHGNV